MVKDRLGNDIYVRGESLEDRCTRYTVTLLGDPEVTANIYCKSRNLPETDKQSYSADLR